MKIVVNLVIIVLVMCASAEEHTSYLPRFVENTAFGPGERLQFSVEYGIIKAGTAVLSVNGPESYEGYLAYIITATAESNSLFNSFFEVHDVNEALLDIVQFHTLKFSKDLNEGDYSFTEEVFFNQDAGTVFYPEETDSIKRNMVIPPHALDVLSCFYFARTLPLEVGETYYIDCHTDNENYPLEIVVHEEETIRVPAGTFECILIEPNLESAGIFRNEGSILIWVTNDERHVPVLMRSAIVIGEIVCVLEEYTVTEPLEVENPGFRVYGVETE